MAAILAGGRASRLGGIAKGLLPLADGNSILARLIEQLIAADIAEVVISANDPRPYASLNVPIIADQHLNIGPLGGIEAVLRELAPRTDSVLFLPCDLPNITAQEILGLVRAYRATPGRVVIARTAEGDHPLCVVVPVAVLPEVTAAIAAGKFGVGRLWRSLGGVAVEMDDAARLANINTPEDLHRWQNSLHHDRTQ